MAVSTATATPPHRRTLAGATVLQMVPGLRDEPAGHAAVDIALMLLQSGARAIIAGEGGALVGELRAFGGEWLDMTADTLNPLTIKRNARVLAGLIGSERIDIVHAHCASAAWSAKAAIARLPVRLVTSFPDRLAADSWWRTRFQSALAQGHRVIAPSSYVSLAMIDRYRISPERIVVIPRSIDTASFSPAATFVERTAALRRAWGVLPDVKIILVPGRVVPWNGQIAMIDAARHLVANGDRNVAIVFVGDDRADRRYRRAVIQRARGFGVDTLIRLTGPCADMAAAYAAASVVVIPAMLPPLTGRNAAEAQAVGRPVVVHAVGVLPENVLSPPRIDEQLRTGWVVRPGQPGELARAIAAALKLDRTAFGALGARARQFAEFMFSPQSVAEAIRGVYTSLLARGP
jgi:glycosyltransferase involved in cell wall biosynthesis